MKEEVKLFNNNFSYTLTDIKGLILIDFENEQVDMKVDTQENESSDGTLLGPTTFGPFNLTLNFYFEGADALDLKLMKQKIRPLLFSRDPYFIWCSEDPERKYAVYCDDLDIENINPAFAVFKATFVAYKGHAESVKSTKNVDFMLEDVKKIQAPSLEDYQYTFTHSKFVIYNAGDLKVDPREHYLRVKIEGVSDGEITINNKTTKDRFVYKPELNSKTGDWIEIDGVYPKRNGVNCGIDTNHQLISLAPGENEIEIQNITQIKTSWDFNFLYR